MKIIYPKSGFTLVELIVTLAVAAILLGWAVPSVSSLLKNSRTTTNVSDFLSALNYTRSEAIKRGSRVTLCIANAAFNQCDSSGTTKWRSGWLIFNDPIANGNTITVVNPTTNLLQAHAAMAGGVSTSLDIPNPGTRDTTHLSFSGSGAGFDQTVGGAGSGGLTFVLCDDRLLTNNKRYARKIIINPQGRARALVADDSNGPLITSCT